MGDRSLPRLGRFGVALGSMTLVAAATTLALTVSGCSSPGVCSAVGYSQSLTTAVFGDGASAVDRVIVCGADGCPEHIPPADGKLREVTIENIDVGLEAPPTTSEASGIGIEATRSSGEGASWSAILSYYPEPLRIILLDSTGTVVSESNTGPDWVRVGGSEECGGPSEASIEIEVA